MFTHRPRNLTKTLAKERNLPQVRILRQNIMCFDNIWAEYVLTIFGQPSELGGSKNNTCHFSIHWKHLSVGNIWTPCSVHIVPQCGGIHIYIYVPYTGAHTHIYIYVPYTCILPCSLGSAYKHWTVHLKSKSSRWKVHGESKWKDIWQCVTNYNRAHCKSSKHEHPVWPSRRGVLVLVFRRSQRFTITILHVEPHPHSKRWWGDEVLLGGYETFLPVENIRPTKSGRYLF